MNDREIIELYWNRDERALSETADTYGNYCYTVAANILGRKEDAEECVNDTLLRAWNAIPPARPAVLRTFLAKITRNLALDRYRRMTADKRGGGQMDLVLEELEECVGSGEQAFIHVDAGESAEDIVQADALGKCIREFAESLPERECNIFVRRYFYAEKTTDIAQRYGMTRNHVSVTLLRLRARLYKKLRKEGFVE
ncbi:MAG: sigma-70 family RNA polymerase sigma factor [Lachnospiraceae bacterium]|nr:sigma-70 family RNA polymerase sigma factor [Lachnospiraceae bacterium]